MEEQLISFETAKLAKKKEFNEICQYYYEILDKPITLQKMSCSNAEGYKQPTAPTQSVLQKWLREVHHIHFEIKPIFDVKDNLKPYHISVIKNPSGKDFEYEIVGSLDTYEETLEIGLQEALKLIK